ncbi:MAG: hypothetical protein ACM3NR_01255 [Methanosarcina sp.]
MNIFVGKSDNNMPKFFCPGCNNDFDTDKPVKKNYTDYLLGPCSKNVAYCPLCGNESAERIVPKPLKAETRRDTCDGDCRRCHS